MGPFYDSLVFYLFSTAIDSTHNQLFDLPNFWEFLLLGDLGNVYRNVDMLLVAFHFFIVFRYVFDDLLELHVG